MSSPTVLNLDPFSGIAGVREAAKIETTDRIKAAIMGKPKSGKSWFAATAPPPVLVYDFSDRAESLAGKEGVFVKTLIDTQQSPTVVKAIEADLSLFQYKKKKGEPIPASVVFDEITNLLPYIKHDYLSLNPKDGRALRLGGNLVQIGMSYDWINVANGFLDYLITEYINLGCNIVFVFHERDEKDQAESKVGDIKYTGMITINPQFISPILSKFNEVFRITVKKQQANTLYTVDCKPTDEVLASTTLLLDATEPPNLVDMIAKHKLRKSQTEKKEK